MTPEVAITADGAPVAALADRLVELSVTDEDGMDADRLEMTLDDRDAAIVFPETGVALDVSAGFRDAPLAYLGRFVVDKVSGEGPALTLRVGAHAADMGTQIRAPRTRAWEDVTLADIVATIAAGAGLEPVVAAAIGATHYAYAAQTAESDLHFLTRLARALDATAKPAAGRLIVVRRSAAESATGEALAPVAIPRERLSGWRWKLDEREPVGTVEAEWGAVAEGETRKVAAGEGEPVKRLRHVFATEAEARRAARAELGLAGRQVFELSAELAGFEPGLFAGGRAELPALRAGLGGAWRIARVRHRYDAGLRTEFKALKPREDAP